MRSEEDEGVRSVARFIKCHVAEVALHIFIISSYLSLFISICGTSSTAGYDATSEVTSEVTLIVGPPA